MHDDGHLEEGPGDLLDLNEIIRSTVVADPMGRACGIHR